jgi:predicted nucleic acid-binding protein
MTEKICIDTNVILYAIDENIQSQGKRDVSLDILKKKPFFSGQSLSEFINVCRKRWKKDKKYVTGITEIILEQATLIPVDIKIVRKSFALTGQYDFQIFDSLIIASALEANCEILYSEDMQHNLLVENQLRIINPFLQDSESLFN